MLVERNKLNKRQTKKNALWVSLYHHLFVYFILYFIKSPNSYVIPVMIGDKNDIKLYKHIALKSRG